MESTKRSWIAVLSIAVAALTLTAPVAHSLNADACIEDGGTAECTGPEVSAYKYIGGNTTWPTSAPWVTTEQAVIDYLLAYGYDVRQACTQSLANPEWLPLPPGASNGTRTVGDPASLQSRTGDYWSQAWDLSVEENQKKHTLRITGTRATNSVPPCASELYSGNLGMTRTRLVACPVDFRPNPYTAPTNAYCYRAPKVYEPRKNLGRCKDCDLLVGNPVNVATGNKYQEERDYIGKGPFPLQYVRRYNSLAYTAAQLPSTGPDFFQRSPNWSGTYDVSVLYNEHPRFPSATVYRNDGRVLAFRPSDGAWVADSDVVEKLSCLLDGSGNPTGWTLITGDDELETYDVNGRLQSIRSRSGLTHTLSYDSLGRLATVTHSSGSHLTFAYDTSGRVASIELPDENTITYEYNSRWSTTKVTYPDGRTRIYHYENSFKLRGLTGITDEDAVRYATFAYNNTDGRVTQTEHAGGVERYTIAYTTSTRSTVTDALSTVRTWDHAASLRTAHVTAVSQLCPGCGPVAKAKTFDSNGNIASRTDFSSNKTCYEYDLTRNIETVRVEGFAAGSGSCPLSLSTYTPTFGTKERKISTQWHATFRLPTQIDESNKRTTFTHDANGNVLTKTVLDTSISESRTWTYTYNSYGQVLTADGPRTDVSDITTYTYYTCTTGYQCGQIHTITNAAGHVTSYDSYNAHGEPLTITDPNGVVTTLAYDLRQRLTSSTVGSEQTMFAYWPTGLLKKATLPDGSYLEYAYDAAHRLNHINDSEGNRIEYTLDAMGNRTAENVYDPSNALTQTRTRVFNTLSQLWKDIGAAGSANVTTEFGYDNNGNQTAINAPLGRNTVQAYDELNRLKQVTDPANGITQYGYNALDQLISVTDPRSKVTSYDYNALGDLKQQVSPDTGTTTNTYDSGGNLATSTDARGKTATYTYDELNRVTSITYPDQTIGYTYDSGTNQKGRLTQVSDASGSTSWSYDDHGRVLSRQQSMGSATKSVGYAYDTAGQLQTLTLPSGNTVTYGYMAGKVTSLTLNGSTTILSNVLYQPFGPTRGWTWGNGTLAVREYDQDGKITDLDSAGLKTYTYDDAFRITGIADASDSSLSQGYGYDLLDRLTSATGTALNQSWTYDANGNRLTQGGSQVSTYTISSASNRISAISGALTRTYAYDAAGNTTGDGTATFSYNDAGRMISATQAGITASYAINALGQRVKKLVSGAATYFVYDEAGHLLGEYDSSGAMIQETVWLADAPVAVLKPDGSGGADSFYIHTDHLNAPRRISRPSDNVVVWRWDSDPFGTAPANHDPDGDAQPLVYNLRFPGQYFDVETGLHYNYQRDYDPQIGRYIESDPIGLRGGINTYSYALENPVTYTDPEGLVPGPRPGYFRRVRCFGEWREKCRQQCANRGGIHSCYVTKGALGMPPKIYVVPTSLSCVCNNDDMCKKDPAACIVGGVVATLGICVAPEVTIPAIILGSAATR